MQIPTHVSDINIPIKTPKYKIVYINTDGY